MKDFLLNKNQSNFSAYISDLNPTLITTNGALTIIDNSDPNHHIEGLVHNSYNIFLDNLFLASGYGFASYTDFSNAAYLVNTYSDSYRYILDQIENFKESTFDLKYSYNETENELANIYNTYGCLTSYKYITIEKNNSLLNSYIINLNEYNTKYIDNIQFKLIDHEDDQGNIIFKNDSFVEVGDSVILCYIFSKYNQNGTLNEIIETSPQFVVNNELVDLSNGETNDNNEIIIRSSLQKFRYHNEDINLICKRDNNIIYSYTYKNFIKWRYRIFAFNTPLLSILLNDIQLKNIYNIDKYNFDDSDFNINSNNSDFIQAYGAFIDFIVTNFDNYSIFLDDQTNIEFLGDGYLYNDEWIYMHDYIVIQQNIDNIDFYFNNIMNNGWKRITIESNGKIYKIFQSPQRYMGKHTWNIRYRNE